MDAILASCRAEVDATARAAYKDAMQIRKRSRTAVAIFVGYAVALQALLLPLSVLAPPPPFAVLCGAAVSDQSPAVPASHSAGCSGCGMQCGSTAALPPPAPDLARVQGWTVAERGSSVLTAATVAPHRSPQIPRAPPFA
jgi:hypothetical protein